MLKPGGLTLPNILVVDDSPGTLERHARGLETYMDAEVLTASDGQEAIETLETQNIDLVISDLSMPVMDGFSLLAYLKRRHPQLPVIIATSLNLPRHAPDLFEQGALPVLRKPVDVKHLVQEAERVLAESSEGHLKGITLPGLLRLLHLERKSCSLLVSSRGRKGRLHFLSGDLVNAYLFQEGREGTAAAHAILGWDDVDIEIERSYHNHKQLIDIPLEELLSEAARREALPPEPASDDSDDPSTDLSAVAEAVLAILDGLLNAPVQGRAKAAPPLLAQEAQDPLQAAVLTLLERTVRAEEALAEVTQAVAVFLEKQQRAQVQQTANRDEDLFQP